MKTNKFLKRLAFIIIEFPVFLALFSSICSADVTINGMSKSSIDVDATIWNGVNTSYRIYTYAKQLNGKPHIYCYTLNETGIRSPELWVSRYLNVNVSNYDQNVREYLVRSFPNRNIPADLTPAENCGESIHPKVSVDQYGTVFVVWEYNYQNRYYPFKYSLVMGIFLRIDHISGTLSFLKDREPFIINSFQGISADGSFNTYNFAPEVECIRNNYFCVLYNEYVPAVNTGERLVSKLITAEDNPGWRNPTRLNLYSSPIQSFWAFATRYYNVPLDINGNRKSCIKKSLLVNRTLHGSIYEAYIAYNGLGFPSRNEGMVYNPGNSYLIILDIYSDYSGYYHMLPNDNDPAPGMGVLWEEGGLPDHNTRGEPQSMINIGWGMYNEKPVLALSDENLVIGFNYMTIIDGIKYYINDIYKDIGQHDFDSVYFQYFTKPNILTDIKSDSADYLILVKKVIDNPIQINKIAPLVGSTIYDVVDLKGVIIPNDTFFPNQIAELRANSGIVFNITTGAPGFLCNSEIFEDQNSKYIYWNKLNPIRSNLEQNIQQTEVGTINLGIPGGIFIDFLSPNACLVLNVNRLNNNNTIQFNWNLFGIDEQCLEDYSSNPVYTLYLFKDDGTIIKVIDRTLNKTASWSNISLNDCIVEAYVVADLGWGISLKSNRQRLFVNKRIN